MKPVMASLKAQFGDAVTYHYHEFNEPDSAQVNQDFRIDRHPEVFILDRRGRLVRKYDGVVSQEDLVATLRPLVGGGAP